MPHATSYGLDWPFTLKRREKKPAASSRRRSHTHYDIETLCEPELSESLRHGVTTVMLGSCSLSTVCLDNVEAGDIFGRVEAIPRRYVIESLDEAR